MKSVKSFTYRRIGNPPPGVPPAWNERKFADKIKLKNTPKMLYYRLSDFEFEIYLEMTHTTAQF